MVLSGQRIAVFWVKQKKKRKCLKDIEYWKESAKNIPDCTKRISEESSPQNVIDTEPIKKQNKNTRRFRSHFRYEKGDREQSIRK